MSMNKRVLEVVESIEACQGDRDALVAIVQELMVATRAVELIPHRTHRYARRRIEKEMEPFRALRKATPPQVEDARGGGEAAPADALLMQATLADLLDAATELRDLMQGVIDGDYKPDSFTLQPIDHAIKEAAELAADPAQEAAPDAWTWAKAWKQAAKKWWTTYEFAVECGKQTTPDASRGGAAVKAARQRWEGQCGACLDAAVDCVCGTTPPQKHGEGAADANVEAVRTKLHERSAVGFAKYGVTTERKDLTRLQWLQHLQEELMDAAVYIEAFIAQPVPVSGDLFSNVSGPEPRL
ncbi:MAG TPA: hypothetical protein VF680_17535 [Allosphingosinicella sp.]|jgi:hypothetical protein